MAKKKKQKTTGKIPVKDPVNVKEQEAPKVEPKVAEKEIDSKNTGQGSKKAERNKKRDIEIEFGPEEEMNKAKQETGEWKDKYQRLYAEFDNFRKRTQKEKLNLIGSASQDLMTALLPVLDDFRRSGEVMEKTDNLASVKDGVKIVANNFSRILEKKGLKPLESAKGDRFNSEIHEAITTIPAGEEHEGKIYDVVEPGYKLNDKVIRYAKVVVGE